MVAFADVAPIFPVRDIDAAAAHYERLGFTLTGDGPYRFAERTGVYIHLTEFVALDPTVNASAAYLYVDDAEALRDEWIAADVGGGITPIVDTAYGLRESAHIDIDGNLLRFGSWLEGSGPPVG